MSFDISHFIPSYPTINSPRFNQSIYNKAEFRIPEVLSTEEYPLNKGDLMAHQTVIARILSSYTPYDGILLMHEMGTGKTCSAIGIIELIRQEKNGFDKYIYVCSSDALRNNFKEQFKGVCTKDDYDDVNLCSIGVFTMTYHGFLKKYKGNNNLKNAVVIIDEVHNIRRTSKLFGSILKNAPNVKSILMSGTPMTDNPDGIAQIMNMILPNDQQIPEDQEFFENLTTERIELLRNVFRGRVSYIKSTPTAGITTTFMINKNLPVIGFKHYKLYASEMSDHQYKTYLEALQTDLSSTTSAAYSNSLQASSFVDEQGGYQKKNIMKMGSKFISKTISEKLVELRKYSSKYADSIKMILDARAEGKNIFVFNRYIHGGGIYMFAELLKQFGISEVKTSNVNNIKTEGDRFMLLTGDPAIDKTKLIERFNRDDNKNGKYIRVVLASDAISEGYTFKNIQIIDIQSPWFQFAKISQAIARGIRFGSHKALLTEIPSVNVEIYLRVSVPPANAPKYQDVELASGIDVNAYMTAEEKDIGVKKIEHIIKEESIDSKINYERNKRIDMDYSRDCDYLKCEFESFPSDPNFVSSGLPTDYSTYQLYYGIDNDLISSISAMFNEVSSIHFKDIVEYTSSNELLVLSVLYNMITTDVRITHKCKVFYLREDNDIYYLTDSISNQSSALDVYYVNNPVDYYEKPKVIEEFEVNDILEDASVTDVTTLIFSLNKAEVSISDREKLIEAVLSKTVTSPIEEQVKILYDGLFGTIDDVMFSWYPLHTDSGPCRKVNELGEWIDCSMEEEESIIIPYINNVAKSVTQRAEELSRSNKEKQKSIPGVDIKTIETIFDNIVYYGMYGYCEKFGTKGDINKFHIFKVDNERVAPTDKRKAYRGESCTTFMDQTKYQEIAAKIGFDPIKKKSSKPVLCRDVKKHMYENNLIIRNVSVLRKTDKK